MADEQYDLDSVGLPITGKVGYAPVSAENVITSEHGGSRSFSIVTEYPAYQQLGLIKQDGGVEDGGDAGEAIEFFQKGPKLAGDDTLTIAVGLAQGDALVRRFVRGKEPDENGRIIIDSAVPGNEFLLFSEVIYKNKAIERVNGVARISELTKDKAERGAVRGWTVTMEWIAHELFDMGMFAEWYIPPLSTAALSITSINPTGKGSGEQVTITGTGFTGVTAVKFGDDDAGMFIVSSSTQIKAVLPPGDAGAIEVAVIRGAEEATRSYTRIE